MDKENEKEEEPSMVLRRRRNVMLKQAAVRAAEQSKSYRETDAHQHLQAAQTSAYAGETFHCSRTENFFWYLIPFLPFLNTEQMHF